MGTTAGSQEGSGKKGEGGGGNLSSDFALATGASPQVLAALPPLQELTHIHSRLVCGDGMGLATQRWRTIQSSSDTSQGGCQPKLWGEEQESGNPLPPFGELAWERVLHQWIFMQQCSCISPARKSGFSSQLSTQDPESGRGGFKSTFGSSLAVQTQEGHFTSLSLSLAAVRWG